MGLLTLGKALDAAATSLISGYIREHGITQFLNTYNRAKGLSGDELRFGDEIECGIFVVDPVSKKIKLSVRSTELLEALNEMEKRMTHQSEGCIWHPEFGNWMIESTPSRPYNNYASDLLRVERNMILRRRRLLSSLRENEIAPYVTCFPLMGVDDFIHDPSPFTAPFSQSDYLPDYIVNPHPRFAALTSNIRARRGSKVDIQVPLFKDTHTPEFLRQINNNKVTDTTTASTATGTGTVNQGRNANTGNKLFSLESDTNIHMDAMGFGMGMCCLQVTFQATDIDESRYIYDQLAVLAPIMLAMTAATPFFKGRVSDIDVRWSSIAQSVDDRTVAERGLVTDESELVSQHVQPSRAGQGIKRIPKSRYDSVSTYIYHCKGDPLCRRTFAKYNDVPCPVDQSVKDRLLANGLDENLAHHISHLFIRDPLVVFEERVELDDTTSMEHFENIQSTNWQTCRWKPPPPQNSPGDPHIGWRTEFRSMEVQLTDFENAAFTVFVVLVTRVFLAFDLVFYIPLSLVDENMKRAHNRNAIQNNKFYFRKYIDPVLKNNSTSTSANSNSDSESNGHIDCDCVDSHNSNHLSSHQTVLSPRRTKCPEKGEPFESIEDNFEEMSMDEIFNGKDDYYPGLIPLVHTYLDYINTDSETRKRLDEYLNFISKRAKGETVTIATWMRDFVSTHPSYSHDSVLNHEVVHDLMMACKQIGEGVLPCKPVLGDVSINRVRPEDAYGTILDNVRLNTDERSEILKRLVKRGRASYEDLTTTATTAPVSNHNHNSSSNNHNSSSSNSTNEPAAVKICQEG